MTLKIIKNLRRQFSKLRIDGYIIPKNDEFFSEYSKIDRLKTVSNFSGSAGFAVILKNKNYLFVDGRYTIQAQLESGNNFQIVKYQRIVNCNLFKNLTLGINPKLFTFVQIEKFFLKNNKIKFINHDLISKISKKQFDNPKPFYSLDDKIVGEKHEKKIPRKTRHLFQFTTA